jgi:hypothetical protein
MAAAVGRTVIGADRRPDPVVEVITAQLLDAFQRGSKDPLNPELLRSIASSFRVLDAVTDAHDLKRHLKRMRTVTPDGGMAERLAGRLRSHGMAVTGDDLLRRHFEARGRGIDVDGITQQLPSFVASGQLIPATALLIEAMADTKGTLGGVAFRERLRGPAANLSLRQTMPSLCGWGSKYAGRWGFLFGSVAFGFLFIPELAVVGGIYAGLSWFFDGYSVWCEWGPE